MAVFAFSCQKEEKSAEQLERERIMAVETVLRENQWGFHDMRVTVGNEARATPLLANVADENGMVQPGEYDSYDIFGNSDRQLTYTYEFTRDDVLLDSTGTGSDDKVAGYYLLNTEEMRLNPVGSGALRFNYVWVASIDKFVMTSPSNRSPRFMESMNTLITNAILQDRPSDISNAVVNLLQNNERIRQAINDFVYDLLRGKIEEITMSSEEISEDMARAIVNRLKEIDWRPIIYNKILNVLIELEVDDPETKAEALSIRIAEKIEARFSQSNIYDVILPILTDFENETLPVLANRIAEAVYNKLNDVLSEENIYQAVEPLWEEFTQADSSTVTSTADTLASVVTNHFFEADSLKEKLIPFVERVDQTSAFQLGNLAQDIIDSVLIPVVDRINGAFPGLDLNPDWNSIKPYITSVLTAIKGALGTSSVEELSETLANAVIGVMRLAIQSGFESAIYRLQDVPPEQAASVISSWISNMVDMAQQPVIDFIEGKLNDIFERFNAEEVSRELASLIHSKLVDVFSSENLYDFILPLLEGYNQANKELIAKAITLWITQLDILPDGVTEETLIAFLSENIDDLLSSVDPDQAAQNLIDLIAGSGLVEQIDGVRLQQALEVKIYETMLNVSREINAVRQVDVVLQRK